MEINQITAQFGSAQEAVSAGPIRWRENSDISRESAEALAAQITRIKGEATLELETAKNHGIRVIPQGSEGYPPLLKELSDAPPIIYIWGEEANWEEPALALVGSRRCSFYGEKVAKELASDLALAGVVTVSGLARGIDSVIHRETLAQGGTTWAVLGSGLLEIYPPENKSLAEAVRKKGALISEFPLRAKPLPYNFPRRNRIISGISLGCVVIEGDEKSGALITGRLAADQGREVFAVPGSIHSSMSRGPNFLIKNGAKLLQNVEDIFDELPQLRGEKRANLKGLDENKDLHLNRIYENILSFIQAEPVHKDVLVAAMKEDVNSLGSILVEMELNGLVRNLPGGFVART